MRARRARAPTRSSGRGATSVVAQRLELLTLFLRRRRDRLAGDRARAEALELGLERLDTVRRALREVRLLRRIVLEVVELEGAVVLVDEDLGRAAPRHRLDVGDGLTVDLVVV